MQNGQTNGDAFALTQGQRFNATGEAIEDEPQEQVQPKDEETIPIEDLGLSGDEDIEEEDAPGDNEPDPEHPRFKQVYGKWKDTERTVGQLQDQLALVRAHNERLARRMDETASRIEEQNPQDPEPDFEDNPSLWKDWSKRQMARAEQATQSTVQRATLGVLVESARMVWDDYDQVVNSVMADIDRDPELNKRIFGSANPPAAAYRYAKEKTQARDGERKTVVSALTVEGVGRTQGGKSALAPKGDEVKLTADDRRVADALGISEKDFLKQKRALAAQRAANPRRRNA